MTSMGKRRPLEGIRIANFGWVWAGPVAGQTLAFLGAEVLKIESRSRIDLTRQLPPFGGGEPGPDRSLSNHACWAGNGSVSINLKKPEGRELAMRLITECDIVIENFGPGVMEKLGMGYKALKAVRDDIILFSMPAAGLDGPLKSVRTYGMSLTSITGVDSLVGYHGGPPIPMENAYSDPYNGILGAFAVICALNHRKQTGQGQHVDYSQQEAVMQMVGPAFMDYAMNGRVAGPMGNRHPVGACAPYGVFPCAGEDRWISIAVTDESEWSALVEEMGSPGWASEPNYSDARSRVANVESLHEKIGEWTKDIDDRELAERLQKRGVAAAPVLSVPELISDPHHSARNTFIEVTHPLGFDETIYGSYVKMSASVVKVETGPVIGRDNDYVFLELLGIDEDRYKKLIDDEIVF